NVMTTLGGVTVSSTSTVSSDAEAVATVKGEDKDDSKQNSGGKSGADGQADQQVNGNSNTKNAGGSDTSLPSAKDNAKSGNDSSSSEGGNNNSGVGVAAAVSVNVLASDNTAKVTHGAHVTANNAVR